MDPENLGLRHTQFIDTGIPDRLPVDRQNFFGFYVFDKIGVLSLFGMLCS